MDIEPFVTQCLYFLKYVDLYSAGSREELNMKQTNPTAEIKYLWMRCWRNLSLVLVAKNGHELE